MVQTILAYVAVAAAAGWVGWRFLPRVARASAPKPKADAKSGDCGPDCGCGD
jgi:hypothetical protein